MVKIDAKMFSGAGRVFDGTLAAALMGLAQADARRVIASLGDVTDNGGGVNDVGGLRATVVFPAFQAGVTDAVAKAEFETAAGGVRDALKEIVAQVNAIRAKVPAAFDTLVDNMGGTAADGTIAAIDDSMTGTSSGGALVSVAGARTVFAGLHARTAQLLEFVNKLRAATGMAEIASEALGDVVYSKTFAAVSTDTGGAVTGADAAANATVSKAAADAALDILSDNVKTISTALNAMTADANATAALSVVAG